MMLNNVDLPQPDGPITARNSPGATVSETLSTAVSAPSGVSNRLVTRSTTRMASAGLLPAALWSRFNGVAAGMSSRSSRKVLLFGFPRHRGRHCRCVARFHAHVDHRHMPLFDGGDRLLERRFELLHSGQRPEAQGALAARDRRHVDIGVADALADPSVLHWPVADARHPLLVQLVIEERAVVGHH